MNRVKAADAAKLAGIKPSSLHRWVRQGRITRYSDGYDIAEILQAEAARDQDALCARAGIRKDDRPRVA